MDVKLPSLGMPGWAGGRKATVEQIDGKVKSVGNNNFPRRIYNGDTKMSKGRGGLESWVEM